MHARFFSRIEERLRGWLSRNPIVYGLYGGIGVVLFWRGVWHGVDVIAMWYLSDGVGQTSIDTLPSLFDALLSFSFGSVMLLSCGLFVSELIGKEIIISGLRGEKKLSEKTEVEVRTETGALAEVLEQLDVIHSKLEELDVKRGRVKRAVPKPVLTPPPLPPKTSPKSAPKIVTKK